MNITGGFDARRSSGENDKTIAMNTSGVFEYTGDIASTYWPTYLDPTTSVGKKATWIAFDASRRWTGETYI